MRRLQDSYDFSRNRKHEHVCGTAESGSETQGTPYCTMGAKSYHVADDSDFSHVDQGVAMFDPDHHCRRKAQREAQPFMVGARNIIGTTLIVLVVAAIVQALL